MQVLLNSLLPVCPKIHSPAFCCSALCHTGWFFQVPLPTHLCQQAFSPRDGGRQWQALGEDWRTGRGKKARVFLPLSDWMVSLASPLWFQLPLWLQNPSSTFLPCFQLPLGGSKSWVSVTLSYLLKAEVFRCPQSLGLVHDFSHALSVTPKPF